MLRSILTPVACSLLATAVVAGTGCGPQSSDNFDEFQESVGEDENTPIDGEREHVDAEPCTPQNIERACTMADGTKGTQHCVLYRDVEVYTQCTDIQPCDPGTVDNWGCGDVVCTYDPNENRLYMLEDEAEDCGYSTPLVLNFERQALTFEPTANASFDIEGLGECVSTDWPTLPWLALDRDHNGTIDSGKELFGSGTILASGERATQGFEALAELDHNHDGQIDAQDPAFAELVMWSDHNGDRRGDLIEQTPLAYTELVAIHLDYQRGLECDNRGNCGRETSTFEYRTATGERRTGDVVDVYLPCR